MAATIKGTMSHLRWANLILAILAAMPPLAHVLELPNKLALDGELWLAVQQNLYRGWGPLLGGPAEIGALATTLALLFVRRANGETQLLRVIAAIAYAAMLVAFFVFTTVLAAFVFAIVLAGSFVTPASLQPVSIPSIVIALGLAYAGTVGGTIRPHYFVVAALVALLAILRPLGVPFHTRDVLLDQLVGVALIVIGVGDHLVLRRTLVPVTHVDAV